jgi:hypothetical protein
MTDSDIIITHAEMHALGREAEGVRFGDGSGYLGQLTVFHNLHCVVSFLGDTWNRFPEDPEDLTKSCTSNVFTDLYISTTISQILPERNINCSTPTTVGFGAPFQTNLRLDH